MWRPLRQLSATISPKEYTASLDPSATTIFQCDVTGADSILWIVDGLFALRQEVRQRGISTSHQVTLNLTEGRFTSNISIPQNDINKNTSILCMACVVQGTDVLSAPAFFKVQDLLGPPPNLTLTVNDLGQSQDDFINLLTWDEPDTLDMTDVEPDIDHYQVCYNISATITCTNVTDRELVFLNVGVNVLFTVTAVNVVGEGNSSTIVHWACDRSTAPTNVSGNEIITLPTLFEKANIEVNVNFTFPQVITGGRNPNCFDVYEVWTTSNSDLRTINHGQQIPMVTVDGTSNTRWLTLSVHSSHGLKENEFYSAIIHAVNNRGRAQNTGDVKFSTYDIQSVSVLPSNESDVLEFNCIFIRGSQAQGCRLTICRELDNGTVEEPQCRNITITRDQNHYSSTKTAAGFRSGLYTISQVTEIERDGNETVHRFVPEFDSIVYTHPPIVTIHTVTTNYSSSLNNGRLWSKFLIISVGSVTAAVIFLIVSLLMIMIVILWYRQRFKAVEPEEVVYDEPYPLAQRPKTELQMEPCPAYGIVLSPGTHTQ